MKKGLIWLPAGFAALAALSAHGAALPELQPGVYINDGGSRLTASGLFAIPDVVDWDEDGRKDLLVGQGDPGKIRLYLNQGTDQAPVFNGSSFIQSSGADIQMGFG